MSRILGPPLIVLALGIAACGDDEDGRSNSASGGSTPAEGAQPQSGGGVNALPGTTIEIGDSQYGEVLFGPQDGAIYYFDKEEGARSECYGACAEAWPPVLTKGAPRAAAGVRASLLGTSKRDDGTTQVTYAGRPLYYYVDDPAGEVLCHDVDEFGGLWLAVEPSGEPVA